MSSTGKQLRDAGMRLVISHNPSWAQRYHAAFRRLPLGWEGIGEKLRFRLTPIIGLPKHHNAWGSMIGVLIKRGALVETGEQEHMVSAKGHAKKSPVLRKTTPAEGTEVQPPYKYDEGAAMTVDTRPLIIRHRPARFDEVHGNGETVAALQRRVKDAGRPHAYLFTGPSGVGKTTIARIVGTTLGADIIEIDAASNNGVDAMRALVDLGHYMPTGAQARLMIIDECHMLSRAAWNALLKLLEEPPAHLFLALCTTELNKIPETIATRCYHVKLDRLTDRQIADLLVEVIQKEDWANTLREDVFPLIVAEADGSGRGALKLLQTLYDAPSLGEAQRIVSLQNSGSVITVLRAVIEGRNWDHVRPLLAQLSDDDFTEATLIQASRYICGAMQKEDVGKRAARLWEMLAAFIYPAHSFDAKAIFYGAIGRILWGSV